MVYVKGSPESVRESRHTQLMAEILQVACKYLPAGITGQSEAVLMGDNEVFITTYHYHLENGVNKEYHIQHHIRVTSSAATAPKT